MRSSNSPNSTISTRTLPCLLILVLFVLTSGPAWAQSSAANHAAPPVNLSNTALALSNTPPEVTNGTATLLGPYNPTATLRLVLGLTPPKLAEEEKFLQELQDKKSANFHKFMTGAEWNARFAPEAKDEQAVVDWATSNSLTVTQRYANRLIVDVQGTTAAIEKAFGVEINSYRVGQNTEFSNDRDPVIPANLVGILHAVVGLNSIQRVQAPHEGDIGEKSVDYSPGPISSSGASMHRDGNKAAYAEALKTARAKAIRDSASTVKGVNPVGGVSPGVTNGYIDPTDIYSSYGYDYGALQNLGHCCNPTNNSGGSPPTTSIAIATAGAFATSDIDGFLDQYPYLAANVEAIYIDGTPSCCNDETTLDTEWSLATANSFGSYVDTAEVFVYEGVNSNQSTFIDIFNQMLSDGNARVFSSSWGCAEVSCYAGSTMDTVHGIFNSMIGQGWTLMVLSHDHGATAGCDDADRVSYPGSDPDVVSVGGTSLELYTDGVFDSETAWQGAFYRGSDWPSTGACANNDGGSGGGCSAYFSAPGYQNNSGDNENPFCGSSSRAVPDVALNAGYGQNYYFNGKLSGVGGTSISTPQVAGFMAQENSYLLYLGNICGIDNGTAACAPQGQADYNIYYEGSQADGYAPHYPFYDITSGCNDNDVTVYYDLGYYCAYGGYNGGITGWGSFNALQMAWMLNYSNVAASGPAYVVFGGPTVSKWYNTDQIVDWDVYDTGGGYTVSGIAGYSQAWDVDPGDNYSEPNQSYTPNSSGTGNSFFSGPQHVNSTFGCTDLNGSLCTGGPVGQGWHTVNVRAWDNMGSSSGNQTYGPIGYDTIPPVTTDSLSGTLVGGTTYKSAVTVTLSASDPGYPSTGSGIAYTKYEVNGEGWNTYSSPFTVAYSGSYTVYYYSVDNAGNIESTLSASFKINPVLSLSPTSLAFGNEVLGTTSAGKTVTITNISSSSVKVSPITSSGDFTISSSTCGSSLAGSGKCSITVTYKPSVLGAVLGDVTIAYGAVGSSDRVGLSGTGLAPLAASPASLSFGTVSVGTTSAAQTLTLKNDNPGTALTISFAANGDYSAVAGGGTPCGATLAAAASCTVNVTFTPHQNGSINGAVSIKDGVGLSPLVVALSGTGSGAVASPLTFAPSSLAYAATVVASGRSKTVTVKNVSAESVKISAISATGDYTSSGCVTTLASGASCTLTVTFKPSTTGTLQGAIAVTNNTAVSPEILDATGIGILPITISPASVSFGTWTVGTTSGSSAITLTNNLTTSATIAFTASGDFSAAAGGGTPCGSSLAAGASCTLVVSFSPTTTGLVTGVATVTHSGGYSPQEVKLSGTGQ